MTSALSLAGAVTIANVGWGYALPAVALSALTVAFAVWAAIPRRDEIRPGDLEDVDRFFSDQLRIRGRLLRLSGTTLCAALISIPIPFIASSCQSNDPVLGLAATAEGNQIRVLARASDVGAENLLLVSLKTQHRWRPIGRVVGPSDENLLLDISLNATLLPRSSFVRAELLDGDEVLLKKSMPLVSVFPARSGGGRSAS